MNIGITGYKGRVGQELLKYPDTLPLMCDIRNPQEIEMAVRTVKPNLIVHLASISDVEKCEDPSNFDLVKNTNVVGTKNVLDVAEKLNCQVVFLSSVHVFDGRWGNYKENHRPHPINMYGLTKLGAEGFRELYSNMKVIRTSYLFDRERIFQELYYLRKGQSATYPTFMERSFMYVYHFVQTLYDYLLRYDDMPPVLHIAGNTTASWYTFMSNVGRVFHIPSQLICPRSKNDKEFAPRLCKGGLNVKLSEKLGLHQYNYMDGLRDIQEQL